MAWQWMSQRGSPPLLPVGPILRRVEPTLVSVWVVTKSAPSMARAVYDNAQGTQCDARR